MVTPSAVPSFSLDLFSLAGRVAVVTGGSDGIGRMIAHGFVDAGASVVIAARTQEKIDNVVAEIEAKGGSVLGVSTDVTEIASVQHMRDAALERVSAALLDLDAGELLEEPAA